MVQELLDMETGKVFTRNGAGEWLKQFSFSDPYEGRDEILNTKVIFDGSLSPGGTVDIGQEMLEYMKRSRYVFADVAGTNVIMTGAYVDGIGNKSNHDGMLQLKGAFSWGGSTYGVGWFCYTIPRLKGTTSLKFDNAWVSYFGAGSTSSANSHTYSTDQIKKLIAVL